MEKTVRLNAEQREDLVAYLDGELPDEQVRQIDQILANSAVARHEVEALSRTWELLDLLPTIDASPEFADKTLSHLKALEKPFVLREQPWFIHLRRTGIAAMWLLSISLCTWFGLYLTQHLIPNPNDELLLDLPTIENLDQYQEIQDIEFLRELKRSSLFDDPQEK
ncbi:MULTISPECIES: anti-sigma factor family protein [unclassified Schlesneria]|uniref:anti-sigma factor family protein n=1 Tax=unclassified Schlesneria TaxID=2762017 RepID=UPI002F1F27AD